MKATIFTEQNKKDLGPLIELMIERSSVHEDWKVEIEKVKEACLEHADDFTIVRSESLANAIAEVWHTNYAKKYSGSNALFSQLFRAAIALAREEEGENHGIDQK